MLALRNIPSDPVWYLSKDHATSSIDIVVSMLQENKSRLCFALELSEDALPSMVLVPGLLGDPEVESSSTKEFW